MSEATPITEQVCPDCGAVYPIAANYCWMCYRPLAGAQPTSQASVLDASGSTPFASVNQATQFGLSTILLTITLVAVLLGVSSMAPGLGVLLGLIVLPAYLRTCITASRRNLRGQPMSTRAKLGSFGISFGVTLCIALVVVAAVIGAAAVALFAVCFSMMK